MAAGQSKAGKGELQPDELWQAAAAGLAKLASLDETRDLRLVEWWRSLSVCFNWLMAIGTGTWTAPHEINAEGVITARPSSERGRLLIVKWFTLCVGPARQAAPQTLQKRRQLGLLRRSPPKAAMLRSSKARDARNTAFADAGGELNFVVRGPDPHGA